MSTFKKHVGRIRNTDRRCVVVYMQIPGNEENALIVDTDALPDRFHDALMDVIDSTEGQQVTQLHTLLARRVMPDSGLDMMNAFHTYGLLRPVSIDNIVMFPAPNAPCPLRTIVDYINGNPEAKSEANPLDNRVLENQRADASQAQIDIANNILQQAADLEAEAAKKREQAYRLVPALRPQVTASPEVTEASVPAAEAPQAPVEAQHDVVEVPAVAVETEIVDAPIEAPVLVPEVVADPDLPAEVLAALEAAQVELQTYTPPVLVEGEVEGNQVDTSDDAVQAFLDRVAHRQDLADKELQASLQPKQPVGRPRKDGLPAGTKPEVAPAAPKKRGRPPKAKK